MYYQENECVYNSSDTYRDGVSYSPVGQDPTDVHRQRSINWETQLQPHNSGCVSSCYPCPLVWAVVYYGLTVNARKKIEN